MDLISRQDAIDAICDNICGNYRCTFGCDARDVIKAIPSAERKQVRFTDDDHVWINGKQYISLKRFQEAVKDARSDRKRGKWEAQYRDGFGNLKGQCNQCGRTYLVDNFCPNCGAEFDSAPKPAGVKI